MEDDEKNPSSKEDEVKEKQTASEESKEKGNTEERKTEGNVTWQGGDTNPRPLSLGYQ